MRRAASSFSEAMSSDVSTDFLRPERKHAQKVRASATVEAAAGGASRRARGAGNGTSITVITEDLVMRVRDDADL